MPSITRDNKEYNLNETKISRLEYQIKSILSHEKFTSFSNECLLSSCTLLLQETNDSIFHTVIEKHQSIIDFSFRLIQCKIKLDPSLSRLGVRVLSRCFEGYVSRDISSLTYIQKLDWEKILQMLVEYLKTFDQNENIEKNAIYFTAELMELCTMVIQIASDIKQYHSLSQLPSQLVAVCIHIQNPSCVISTEKDNIENNHDSMEIVLKHILGTRGNTSDNDFIASFISAASQFLAVHVHTLLPISAFTNTSFDITNEKNLKCQEMGIISRGFLLQLTNLLFKGIRSVDCSMTNMKTDMHLMLHYALISYMCIDIKICEEFIEKKETDVISLFQKIVLAGLTSDSDVTFNTYLNMNISDMIRTMTLFITAEWVERLGYFWLLSSSVSSEDGSALGSFSVFCTMTRLVAGELRIVLGALFDCVLDSKDPDKKEISVSSVDGKVIKVDYDQYLQRGIDCIKIQLSVLHMMVEIANDDGYNTHMEHSISADAILNIRHSLQDTFDSCIQFLSEKAGETMFTWRPIYQHCIRFIGAYLSEVNVFDHGDEDDIIRKSTSETLQQFDRHGRRNDKDSPTSAHTSVSVTGILRAMKNGLLISTTDEETAANYSVTLFPCIVAAIACCESPEQAQLLCKELLSDSTITEAICNILECETRRVSKIGPSIIDDESKNRISWCCVMLDTILHFDSTLKPRTFPSCLPDSIRQNILEHLFNFSKYVGSIVCGQYDAKIINDFVPLLIDAVECWKSVSDSLHSSSSSHTCVEEEMQIMNLYTWLNDRGHFE